ncbi:MAG: thioredoxin family protein, partial [Thermomicrobiaceae bacterium]|nr:thioredoxin family protein [Thermomicrobiaceae bacterium]
FLVITEDWCSDSAQFVPVVARLAREVPGVELRVLRRDEHHDLAERYPRKDGYHAIPIFILFDGEMRELGSLVERPTRAAEEIAAETRKFQREHPELPGINRTLAKQPEETRAAVKAHIREWRQGQQERWTRFLLDELAAIVEAGRARRDA